MRLKYGCLMMTLLLLSSKVSARNGSGDPVIRVFPQLNIDLREEMLYYAKALDIDESTTIQVRFSLRMPSQKSGIVQYKDTGFPVRRHQVTIWINRRLTPVERSMTIAHEMVHVAQYIKGRLRLLDHQAIWEGDVFKVDRFAYNDRPWEQEALTRALILRSAYLSREKCSILSFSGIHPPPEAL